MKKITLMIAVLITSFSFSQINNDCPNPSNLAVSNITTTTADLGWMGDASAFSYNVEVVLAGTSPTEIATDSGVSNPFTKMGLSAGLDYEFYVQASCGLLGVSNWVGPFAFITSCTITSFPWTENFNNIASGLPICWDENNNNGDNRSWGTAPNTGVDASRCARLFTQVNGSNDDYLILPQFTLTGNEILEYFVRPDTSNPQEYRVVLSTTGINPADFNVELKELTAVNNFENFTKDTIDLSAYSGDVYIAIHVSPGALSGTDIYFDDFSMILCREPSNLSATNITNTSAEFSWTDNGSASVYNVEVVIAGNSPTGIPTDSGVSNPFTKTGLDFSTNSYQFYVQADCTANGLSTWVGSSEFCSAESSFPWIEDFETITTPNIPDCWEAIDNDNNNSSFFTVDNAGLPNNLKSIVLNGASNSDDYLVLPRFTLTGSEELRYYVKSRNTSNFNSYRVALSTTGKNPEDFNIELKELAEVGNTYIEEIIDLSAYSGDIYIAIHVPASGGTLIDFDSFTIQQETLSTNLFNTESLFTYYPNPVNNNLKLKAQKEISNVSVYNMIGQKVYNNSHSSINKTIDMSNLQSGVYFIDVTIQNITETVKIIKQ